MRPRLSAAQLLAARNARPIQSLDDLAADTFESDEERRPYGLYVHGASDTGGAVRAVEAIATRLAWPRARPPLSVIGPADQAALDECSELARSFAITQLKTGPADGSPAIMSSNMMTEQGKTTVSCKLHDPPWTADFEDRRRWMLAEVEHVLAHAAGAVHLLGLLGVKVTPVQITRWVQASRLVSRSRSACRIRAGWAGTNSL